jgi:hypothetical protein
MRLLYQFTLKPFFHRILLTGTAARILALASACILTASAPPVSAESLLQSESLSSSSEHQRLAQDTPVQEQESQAPVQVFDVQKERVLTTRPNSSIFRQQVERWIRAAQHLSGRARLEADAGIVVRIPLQPPLPVRHSWLSIDVTEVYLFIDPKEKENPHLLLFSREGKPYVIDISENPDHFLKEHGLLRYVQDSSVE